MAGQSIPHLSCDGHVACGNILWGRNEGQHILKGIPMEIIPHRPEKKTISPTLCIHFTCHWVSFTPWMIPGYMVWSYTRAHRFPTASGLCHYTSGVLCTGSICVVISGIKDEAPCFVFFCFVFLRSYSRFPVAGHMQLTSL